MLHRDVDQTGSTFASNTNPIISLFRPESHSLTMPASSTGWSQPPARPQSQSQAHQPQDPSSSFASHPQAGNETRQNAFPFSFKSPLQPNQSSTTLVSSTAEGKPIPVDDSTAEHRTSALREFNHHYPSRHRYARSTGAQSSTYSEPVIVRSYYAPAPPRPGSSTRNGIVVHQGPAVTAPQKEDSDSGIRRIIPFTSNLSLARNGMLNSMGRARGTSALHGGGAAEPRLPPVEAFTFKSFLAGMDSHGESTDISTDLDRIAEICAKSRYSLSNQYEVHYQPHGSGSSFMGPSQRGQDVQGPTLQVVSLDEDHSTRRVKRGRGMPRRNSRAMGRLETIMSSSRSSEEGTTRKPSAAELADEVRGRASNKGSTQTSPTVSPRSDRHSDAGESPPLASSTKRTSSLALMDGSLGITQNNEAPSPRSSAGALTSQPALPRASTSQLELRTTLKESAKNTAKQEPSTSVEPAKETLPFNRPGGPFAIGAMLSSKSSATSTGLFTTLSSWMPWKPSETSAKPSGRAEGSLREILKTADYKGKSAVKET